MFFPAGCKTTAVDLSPQMLIETKQHALQLGQDIETLQMDACYLGYPDNSFDTVISALSTCIFPDPIVALQEMKSVCKPEGRILLLEHGRNSFEPIGRYHDRFAPQKMQSSGCRDNQESQGVVKEAGLTILSSKRGFLGFVHAMEVSPL